MNTKSRSFKFFYNGALLSAVGIGMRTVALFFNAFITREVGAEGVGLYTIVMTVYNFAVTFATSGISLTVTRLVASAKGEGHSDKISKILRGSIIYALGFSTIGAGVLFLSANFFAGVVLGDARAASCLRILSPSLIPLALVSVFSGYFVGIRKVSMNATTQVLCQFFKIALTVYLVINIPGGDVERSAYALSIGTTLTELLAFVIIFLAFLADRYKYRGNGGVMLAEVAGTAIPLALSAYIRSALLTLEHILIPKSLRKHGEDSSEALASYGRLHGMALPLVLYPMATLTSFSGLLVPEFAERDAARDIGGMKRIATRAFETTLIYAILVSIMLFFFSEELGYVIYNSYSAGIYIAILAPVVPIMYLDHLTDNVLKGIGEQVYSMWVNISDSILSIILVFFLIPKMGIVGYAVAIVLMEAYNFLLSAIRLFSKIKFKISVFRAIVNPLISGISAGYISHMLFALNGAETGAAELITKLIFSLMCFIGFYKILSLIVTPMLNKSRNK